MPTPKKNVIRLGLVSLLNDLGSETLTRLIPLYVVGVLGASMSAVGTIEGLADATAVLLKPIFGQISDRFRKRKVFIVWGYALSAGVRPLLSIAQSWPGVAFLRLLDRLGKGVRTAPRDALIAESTEQGQHGRSFGMNRALDTLGALLGVSVFGLWAWKSGAQSLNARTWVALTLACSLPGFLAVALTGLGVRDAQTALAKAKPLTKKPLNPVLKRYLLVIAVFSLANSSDAFILLRARQLGYSLAGILGIIALLNLVSSMTAIPAAALSDRLGRRALIATGWTIYAITYGLLGSALTANSTWFFGATVAIYGLFYGFTEGVERAWIADLTPSNEKASAYGWFGLVVGVISLPASLGFGWVWDHYGSPAAFLSGCAIALFATGLLFILLPQSYSSCRSNPIIRTSQCPSKE